MSTSLYDALASAGLAPTDDDNSANPSASEQARSKKLSADDFALHQRLAEAFPTCFSLQHPVPLMNNIEVAIRSHRDFRQLPMGALGKVLTFVTGRRPYLLCLTRKGAHRHALDGTPIEPVEPDVRQEASAELKRLKAGKKSGKG